MTLKFMGDSAEKCDRNFIRNKTERAVQSPDTHPTITCLLDNPWLKPSSILEIGAGSGCVLARMQSITGAKCYGIEPSPKACKFGNESFEGIKLYPGSAEVYPEIILKRKYELILFGGVLFHISPLNFFKCITNALAILEDNGYIMIFDFHSQGSSIYRKYRHEDSQYVYKYDHTRILTAHPSFRLLYNKLL